MESKKITQNSLCDQTTTSIEGGSRVPLVGDLLNCKNLPVEEKENLYNVLCWLCIGLAQCRQQSTCRSTCCKGMNVVKSTDEAFEQTLVPDSLCDQKSITVAVASIIHPEIASKFNV